MDSLEHGERLAVRQRTENSGSASTSGRIEVVSIRDELAEIGEGIKDLQGQLGSIQPGAASSQSALERLWMLLWQLRPYLFLASPATARQWKIGSDVFRLHHRRHYVRDAAHVAIALRLYVALFRFTVVCPAAALHGCLTLLSIFSVLNDPRLRSWRDNCERLQEMLLFVLRPLHTSDSAAFTQVSRVMRQLLAEVAAHFDDVPPDEASQPHLALFLDLRVQPSTALLSQTEPLLSVLLRTPAANEEQQAVEVQRANVLHEVFTTHICVETAYEARCVQTGLLQLLTRLVEQRLMTHLPRDDVVLLCDVACHLVSRAVPGAEGGVVNQVQHEVAWHAIRFFVGAHFFLPHVQGPLLLSVLTARWQSLSSASIFDVTVAEQSVLSWLLALDRVDLLTLVSAFERRAGSASGAATVAVASVLTACMAQMWEIAVRWCVELYGAPTCGLAASTSSVAVAAAAQRTRSAAGMLADWVTLCERFFCCTVQLSSPSSSATNAGSGISNTGVSVHDAEYAHRLQLLADELSLPSITASLLCTQTPPSLLTTSAADGEAFLPHRILTFFSVPAMPAYVAAVVEKAQNCVDVSAYRLLEANALSVLSALPRNGASYSHIRCDAQAFCTSLQETVQVLMHHESPSYSLLLQALIVLLHFFSPRDAQPADCPASAVVVPRVVQELDAALATRLSNKPVLPGVSAPLWHGLYKSIAISLFRGGSGLSWSRRALSMPEAMALQPSGAAAEAFLSRAAGVVEGLHEALATRLLPSSIGRNGEEKALLRLRCTYESLTSVLSVALPLLSVLESVLRSVERYGTSWRAHAATPQDGKAHVPSGTLLAAASLLSCAAHVQLQLLEAKYTFACIAGPAGVDPPSTSPAKETRSSKSHSRGAAAQKTPKTTSSTGPAAAVVVDVDDDDDEHADAKAGKKRHDEADAGGRECQAPPTSAAAATSKTHLLERILELHHTQLLPAALAALRAIAAPEKSSSSSAFAAASAGGNDAKESAAADDDTSNKDNATAELLCFRRALLRFAYTTLALSPPTSVDGGDDLRLCFSFNTVTQCGDRQSGVAHVLAPLAAREVMMWSSFDRAALASAGTGQRAPLFLQWLSASEKLTTLLNTRPENVSAAMVAGVGQDAMDLLWFARRCFQDVRAATTISSAEEPTWVLSRATREKQEACFVGCRYAVQEARGWLALCFDLYGMYRAAQSEAHDAALGVMGLCVETARDVMTLFAWSATDLLRFRERPFVFSSFLKAVVDKEDRDMKVVLSASLDVLGRYWISADSTDGADNSSSGCNNALTASIGGTAFVPGSEFTRTRLKLLIDREGITEWSSVAGAVAYVLYEYGSKPLTRQMQYLGEVMSCLGKTVKDIPALVRSSKHMIAFHLVSLEADAQLLAREQRRRSGRERRSVSPLPGAAAVSHESLRLAAYLGCNAHRLFLAGGTSTISCSGNLPNTHENAERRVQDEQTASAAPRLLSSPTPLWRLPSEANEFDHLDGIAFSVFERAVEQMVTLCESAETVAAVESSLRKPVGRAVAAEELWKSMFAVLDSIYKAVRIEPVARCGDDGTAAEEEEGVAEKGAPGSLRTRRRWLLGLASFIRFMGPQTTPIALMLPTLLERCSRLSRLVPFVCIVWKELVCACTEEYLAESAPSIALSLVSLEQHAAPQEESRVLLTSALQHLYKRTESAGFWDAYKVVLGTSSELVALVLQPRRLDEETRVAASDAAEESELRRASNLLSGFVEVMRSGSLQSTTVFVRALYQYLSVADTSRRLQLSKAASWKPEVVQTLLRCSEADTESAVYAMRCISIIGAVTSPATTAAAVACRSNTTPSRSTAEASKASASSLAPSFDGHGTWTGVHGGGGQSSYLDAETVLNWRKFAFTLLREYFPRVFASTADPVLHNCIAFAVQELIRASTMQERRLNKGVQLRSEDMVHVDELERYLWWARLTPNVKQLLGAFTTTRYSLTVNWKTRLRAPEYVSGLSYRRWLFNFFNHLVASCEGWFAEMVQPLRNVAKRNSPLILYLLPYLVVHLLESGKLEDEQYLECEMKTVLEAVAGGQSHTSLSLRSQSIYEVHPDAVPLQEPREHAHTVLSILEDVEQLRWSLLRNRGRVPCVFDQQEQTESTCIHLSERYGAFLRLVPWALRCRAALRIGSHVRALRSVEGQRRIPDLAAVIQSVPLQRIFAALDDRESSRSIHRASPGLSLEDTAFSLENNGDWLAALSSSELVLQHRPSSGQHQLTALHCMNELGELYMTSRYAASLLASQCTGAPQGLQPAVGSSDVSWWASTTLSQLDAVVDRAAPEDAAELRSHVQAYANEAAWRLGQWDTLLPDELAHVTHAAVADDDNDTAAFLGHGGGGASVSLAMPAAYLQRELSGRCALPYVRAVTDAERLKIVPMVRTPCQEDLTAQGYTFTLLLHALGDVDAVSDLLCANISVLDSNRSGKGAEEEEEQLTNARRGTDGEDLRLTPSRISAALLPSAVKDEIVALLSLRASYAEDTIAVREPLLSLHRMVYREMGVPQKVAETWLKQSELLRDAGLDEAALTAARQAAYECPEHIVHTNYYTLVANLLHDTQSATPAMEFARECLGDARIPAVTRAKVQVLLTNWLVETGSERPERVFAEYDKARELDRRSELVHYQMAVFYDHLHTLATNASENAAAQLTTSSPTPQAVNAAAGGGAGEGGSCAGPSTSATTAVLYSAVLMHQKEMVESIRKHALNAITHFGEALLRGTEKASVSLPRMLTLWLDSAAFLGSLMSTTAGKLDGSAAGVLEDMNTKVRTFILSTVGTTIPPGVVMTALPQLLSRLAHPVPSVRWVLTDVVVYLLNCFPQQCLWLVLPMTVSKDGPREIVETQIIKPFADNPRNERVLRYAKIICDTLLAICNCSASLFPKERGLTQLSPVQKLNPMLSSANFVLPVLSNLTPNITAEEMEGVFATSPCFDHFEDRVIVMHSLQKPKRIWVATNEGREMSFLCKAKDEPRKDIRMMEVATLMNSFFLSDPEARRKRFSLRRYSITALSDDCAVIEWLNDTSTLSKVAVECYTLDRSGVHVSSVKKWLALVEEKKLSKMDLFTKYILPEAPPVLHQWLDRTFASNQHWYEARNLFTQSTALWSIAGHIVGLGDRHAENLMLDLERGELMHVDFACMFDKGEKLEVPEQVRFRLTQNLTDAMGVLGAYGPFQAACEVALRCEMKNKSAVMSIVETLLHEPLVEWRRQSSRASASGGPKQLMERVARRLDGFLDLFSIPPQRDTLALNVESQVSKLIHHSSDLNNLSQMYIWWMAWI
ncbi:phosphatidylinositol 3-related kinase [Lotmaria passim]